MGGLGGVADEEVPAFIDICIKSLIDCLLDGFIEGLPMGRGFTAEEATEGVNRGMNELKNEYINKWVLESRMPPSFLMFARGMNHMANVKDLLSNYIGFN